MSVMSIRCTYSLTEAMSNKSTKTLVDEICADSCSHIYAEAALIKNKDRNKNKNKNNQPRHSDGPAVEPIRVVPLSLSFSL